MADEEEAAAATRDDGDSDLAHGWRRVYSEAEGNHYFYSAAEGRSQWTKPEK
jgi:hypothetical protein